MVVKRVPLRPIFRVGNNQKSLGARSGEYGGWVMTGMLYSARNCCTTSDVWIGANALFDCPSYVYNHMARNEEEKQRILEGRGGKNHLKLRHTWKENNKM